MNLQMNAEQQKDNLVDILNTCIMNEDQYQWY